MYWCFHCYAVNDHPRGPCDLCGQPVEEPVGLSYVDRLVWALDHPDGDRAVVAAETLGKLRASESAPALRKAVETGPDPYVRAAALQSLLVIEDPPSLRPWLICLTRTAPFLVRDIARRALDTSALRHPPR
jgi:HEAT repeat protein